VNDLSRLELKRHRDVLCMMIFQGSRCLGRDAMMLLGLYASCLASRPLGPRLSLYVRPSPRKTTSVHPHPHSQHILIPHRRLASALRPTTRPTALLPCPPPRTRPAGAERHMVAGLAKTSYLPCVCYQSPTRWLGGCTFPMAALFLSAATRRRPRPVRGGKVKRRAVPLQARGTRMGRAG
jgi:hypothetical protein